MYETSNKNWFWSIKNSGEVLSKLKCRGFRATSLSTYDFSTLYTTLPHNLIQEKLLDLIEKCSSRQRSGKGAIRERFPLQKPRWEKTKLTIRYLYHKNIEWTFKRALKTMVHYIWHVMTERLSSLPLIKVGLHFGHVRICATPYPFSWIIFILDLGPNYTDKLSEFQWVQIAHLS